MCERFAYYGTTAVFVNFIQRDLPTSGPFPEAGAAGDGQPGALGMGQRASTGLVQFNSFFSYIMPLVGKRNLCSRGSIVLILFTRRMGC